MTKPRVLVVEDNELNMELISDVLELAGFEVMQATDGPSGVEAATADRPDLILMDLQLPGMDGLEATRSLKANPATRNIPVVAVTSHAMKGGRDKALAEGCAGYITKPIDVHNLAAEVRRHLPR